MPLVLFAPLIAIAVEVLAPVAGVLAGLVVFVFWLGRKTRKR